MTILHLSAVSNWGGGEHQIENLCKELELTDPAIHNIIFCVRNKPFHQRLKETEIKHITAPLSIKIDLRYAFKLGRICKAKQIDLIHIHDPTALQLAVITDKIYDLPPFIFSKKTSFDIRQRKKTLYKYNYPKIKKILCVSKETQRISEKAIVDHNKLTTIYHGTNIHKHDMETPFKLRDKYQLENDRIIVGNVANHIPAKDLDTFINVVDRIINQEQQTQFFFVQIGTFTKITPSLLKRIEQLQLTNYIDFLGYKPRASHFIPQFDMALMTSQSEGVPQFIYESMLHKVPVVSTDVGGIPEIIEHGINGYLAPKHDDNSLAQCILKLLKDADLRTKFVNAAYKKLVENFTTAQMVKQTVEIYKEVLNDV